MWICKILTVSLLVLTHERVQGNTVTDDYDDISEEVTISVAFKLFLCDFETFIGLRADETWIFGRTIDARRF